MLLILPVYALYEYQYIDKRYILWNKRFYTLLINKLDFIAMWSCKLLFYPFEI